MKFICHISAAAPLKPLPCIYATSNKFFLSLKATYGKYRLQTCFFLIVAVVVAVLK